MLKGIGFYCSFFSFVFLSNLTLNANAMSDYIQLEDLSYQWKVAKTWEEEGCQVIVLQMTSQKWRSEKEVDNPFWKHWVKIIVPRDLQSKTALLFVRGGKTFDPLPQETSSELFCECKKAKAVIAEVFAVPNQNLKFLDDPDERFKEEGRKEDAIIAYSWKKFIATQDPSWPLRLPMTKAIIRTMDTVSACLKERGLCVESFVLTGESKRGWAVWTAAAMDSRIKAIVPVVCDFLNTKELLVHHYRSYGAWSAVFREYVAADLEKSFFSQAFADLLSIEDPYSYREEITIPKLLISSTGDSFSVSDALQHYLPGLRGKTYVRFVPNSDHYLYKYNYFPSVYSFFNLFIQNAKIPEFAWKWKRSCHVELSFDQEPIELNLWCAHNEKARDFRKGIAEVTWSKTTLPLNGEKRRDVVLKKPEKGWCGYFIEAVYPGVNQERFTLTTEVFILPDELPFPFDNSSSR